MEYIYSYDETSGETVVTGVISKSDLGALPQRIKDDLLATVSITETADDYITFKIQNEGDANRLSNAIRRFEQSKRRRVIPP